MNALEAVACMWVVCDPNRQGTDPDAPASMVGPDGVERSVMAWEWFVPRAQASLEYLRTAGFAIVPVEPTQAMVEAAGAPYRYQNTAQFDAILDETIIGYYRDMLAAAGKE